MGKKRFNVSEDLVQSLGTPSVNLNAYLNPVEDLSQYSGTSITPNYGDQLAYQQERYNELAQNTGGFFYGDSEQQRKSLAELDSGWQSLNPIRILGNIGLGIIELGGYLGELSSYAKSEIMGEEYVADFSNSLTEWTKEKKQELEDVTGGQVILREDGVNFTDSKWWIQSGAGLIESIAEFAITGMGVGSMIKSGTSLLAKTLAKQALKLGQAGVAGAIGATGDALAVGATSATLAYTEGAMAGADVFKKTYDSQLRKTSQKDAEEKGFTSPEEYAKQVAANAASTTVKLNTLINSMLNLSSVYRIFAPPTAGKEVSRQINSAIADSEKNLGRALTEAEKATIASGMAQKNATASFRKLLGDSADDVIAGFKSRPTRTISTATGLEMAQEGTEELVNEFAQKTGEELGKQGKTDSEFTDYMAEIVHFYDRVATKEGLASAILGALGGAGQTVVTDVMPKSGVNPETGKKEWSSSIGARNKREEFEFNSFVTDLGEDFKTVETLTEEIYKASAAGDLSKVREKTNELFVMVPLMKSLRSNNGEYILSAIKGIGLVDNTKTAYEEADKEYQKIVSKVESEGRELTEEEIITLNQLTAVKNNPESKKTQAMKLGFATEPDSELNDQGKIIKEQSRKLEEFIKESKKVYDDYMVAYNDGSDFASKAYAERLFRLNRAMAMEKEYGRPVIKQMVEDLIKSKNFQDFSLEYYDKQFEKIAKKYKKTSADYKAFKSLSKEKQKEMTDDMSVEELGFYSDMKKFEELSEKDGSFTNEFSSEILTEYLKLLFPNADKSAFSNINYSNYSGEGLYTEGYYEFKKEHDDLIKNPKTFYKEYNDKVESIKSKLTKKLNELKDKADEEKFEKEDPEDVKTAIYSKPAPVVEPDETEFIDESEEPITDEFLTSSVPTATPPKKSLDVDDVNFKPTALSDGDILRKTFNNDDLKVFEKMIDDVVESGSITSYEQLEATAEKLKSVFINNDIPSTMNGKKVFIRYKDDFKVLEENMDTILAKHFDKFENDEIVEKEETIEDLIAPAEEISTETLDSEDTPIVSQDETSSENISENISETENNSLYLLPEEENVALTTALKKEQELLKNELSQSITIQNDEGDIPDKDISDKTLETAMTEISKIVSLPKRMSNKFKGQIFSEDPMFVENYSEVKTFDKTMTNNLKRGDVLYISIDVLDENIANDNHEKIIEINNKLVIPMYYLGIQNNEIMFTDTKPC